MFSWFYAPNFGLFYKLIEWIMGSGVALLADPDLVTYGIIAAGLWPQIAYCMILYLTGLNNVSPDQVETARLDGVKGYRMGYGAAIAVILFLIMMICITGFM